MRRKKAAKKNCLVLYSLVSKLDALQTRALSRDGWSETVTSETTTGVVIKGRVVPETGRHKSGWLPEGSENINIIVNFFKLSNTVRKRNEIKLFA